jgi:hypothetical protein
MYALDHETVVLHSYCLSFKTRFTILGFYEKISLVGGGEIILRVVKYVVFVGCAHGYC